MPCVPCTECLNTRDLVPLQDKIIIYFYFIECIKREIWSPSDYINLHSPISQCVPLQWTLRDREVVSLPINLLVEGDIVYLRPGQSVPGRCKQVLVSTEECSQFSTCFNLTKTLGKQSKL